MPRRHDLRARRTAGLGLRPGGRAAAPGVSVSLARALSKFGVCSRREAARLIADSRVRVDGRVERSAGRFIDPARHRVLVDGRRVGDDAARVVIALHKPVGLVTTRVDPGGRPTVYDALGDLGRASSPGARPRPGWVFPVGRLDRDSSGLLILTNDHRLGERLTSPEHHVPKTYHVRVCGVPDAEALRALREGLLLGDGTATRPARVRVIGTPPPGVRAAVRRAGDRAPGGASPSTWLEIVLSEGKNRQLRRMGAAVGHEVLELVRVAIGGLALGSLAPGEWRELAPAEVAALTDAGPGRPSMMAVRSRPGGPR